MYQRTPYLAKVKKVRQVHIGGLDIYFMGISGLGVWYMFNGLFYWLGTGGFLVSRAMEDRSKFLAILQAKRPDLFTRNHI